MERLLQTAIRPIAYGMATAVVSTMLLATDAEAQANADDSTAIGVEQPTRVHVSNNGWLDVRVYALNEGRQSLLGRVTAFTGSTFKIPERLLAPSLDLRILADAVGSREDYVTPRLQVAAGDIIELQVEDTISFSTVTVWRP